MIAAPQACTTCGYESAVTPAVAVMLVRRWRTREGFADADLRPHLRRVRRHCLLAGLLPFPFLAAAAVLAAAFGFSASVSRFGAVIGAGASSLVIFSEVLGRRSYPQALPARRLPNLACVSSARC